MAFKQKGFSAHAGVAKQHMGSDRGSAVFKKLGHPGGPDPGGKHGPHAEESPKSVEWDNWVEGEVTTAEDGGTSSTDTRKGIIRGDEVEKRAETPEEIAAYRAWKEGGGVNTRYDDQNVTDSRSNKTPGTPPPPPASKHSMRVSKHPGWPNHGGPVRNSAGDIQDASGVIGMEVDGEMYNFPWASHGRSGQRNKSMEDLKVSNPEAYEEAINMAAESGYSGGGSDADLKVNGGGWDQTRYDTTSARNPGEEPGWTPEGGRTTKEMRANPTQSVASPSTYEGEVVEPLMDPSIFKKGRSPLFKKGYRTKSWI